MITRKIFFLLLILIASGCEHNPKNESQLHGFRSASLKESIKSTPIVDSLQSKRKMNALGFADTLAFKTKPGFEADEVIIKNDTLLVIASSKSILYPLGQVQHSLDIKRKYPFFALTKGQSEANGQLYPYTLLRFKNSAIKFYDNEEDGATVIAGSIVDKEIVTQNAIHVGQSLDNVLGIFFLQLPNKKIEKLHILRMDYVVDRIKYYYEFENGELVSIKMDSYSIIDKSL